MKELKTEKIDIFGEIENEMLQEIGDEKEFNNENFKEIKAKPRNLVLTILEKMLGKLLCKLKIKIVVSWNDKELFTYVIPKN